MGIIRILTFPPSLSLSPKPSITRLLASSHVQLLVRAVTSQRTSPCGKATGGARDEDSWEVEVLSEMLDYVTIHCRRAWLKRASAAWGGGGVTPPPWTVVAIDILLPISWELSEADCHPAALSIQQWPSVCSSLADLLVNFSFNFPPSRITLPRSKQAFSSLLQSRQTQWG